MQSLLQPSSILACRLSALEHCYAITSDWRSVVVVFSEGRQYAILHFEAQIRDLFDSWRIIDCISMVQLQDSVDDYFVNNRQNSIWRALCVADAYGPGLRLKGLRQLKVPSCVYAIINSGRSWLLKVHTSPLSCSPESTFFIAWQSRITASNRWVTRKEKRQKKITNVKPYPSTTCEVDFRNR